MSRYVAVCCSILRVLQYVAQSFVCCSVRILCCSMLQYPWCVAVCAYLVNAVHRILLNLEEKARGELVVVCASVEERWRGVRKHLRRHEIVCFDGCLHVVLCVREGEREREREEERKRGREKERVSMCTGMRNGMSLCVWWVGR